MTKDRKVRFSFPNGQKKPTVFYVSKELANQMEVVAGGDDEELQVEFNKGEDNDEYTMDIDRAVTSHPKQLRVMSSLSTVDDKDLDIGTSLELITQVGSKNAIMAIDTSSGANIVHKAHLRGITPIQELQLQNPVVMSTASMQPLTMNKMVLLNMKICNYETMLWSLVSDDLPVAAILGKPAMK